MIPNKKTFCIAPFKHAHINTEGSLKFCCQSQEHSTYKFNDIKNWFKSKPVKKLRNNLVKGIKDPVCMKCWVDEDNGKTSQREIYNKYIGNIIPNAFEKSFEKNKILKNILIDPDNHLNIDTYDIKLGNHCNLKCIMCKPMDSSELLLEARKNKELAEFYTIPDSKNFVWPKKEDFKDWCQSRLGNSTWIKFTGGEPFLNPYMLETLKNISMPQRKKCVISIVTNLTIINEKIIDIFKDFKETWIGVSVEGTTDVLEYARYGHKWKDFKKNLLILTENKKENLHLTLQYVVQTPTILGIMDLIKFADENSVNLHPLFLKTPKEFTLQSMKTKHKLELLKTLKNYYGHNQNFVESLCAFIEKNLNYDKNQAQTCVYRLQAFDKIRNTNFQKIIPIDYLL